MKHECVYCEYCYLEDGVSGTCNITKETIPNVHAKHNCKLFRQEEHISTEEWQAAIDPHYGRRWE